MILCKLTGTFLFCFLPPSWPALVAAVLPIDRDSIKVCLKVTNEGMTYHQALKNLNRSSSGFFEIYQNNLVGFTEEWWTAFLDSFSCAFEIFEKIGPISLSESRFIDQDWIIRSGWCCSFYYIFAGWKRITAFLELSFGCKIGKDGGKNLFVRKYTFWETVPAWKILY